MKRGTILALTAVVFVAVTGLLLGSVILQSESERPEIAELDVQEAAAASLDLTVPADLDAARERIFTSEWRPELSAESALCLTGDLPVQVSSSGTPLDQPISAASFIHACEVSDLAPDYERPYVCYDDGNMTVVVVEGECAGHPSLRSMDSESLARLNDLRVVEMELLGVPSEESLQVKGVGSVECPTVEEASAWADQVLDSHSLGGFDIRAFDEGSVCYRPIAYWSQSEVVVQPYGYQPEG